MKGVFLEKVDSANALQKTKYSFSK